MPTPLRPARSAALLASLAAAGVLACSTESPAPITCDTDESCPATSRCAQRACVADAPPLAHIASLEGVEANDLAALDGSRSSDPDAPDDAVVSYEWTATAVNASCEPPVIAGTTARPLVRFACPGRYEVSLVVTDEMSVRSEPARVTVDVAPRSGEPLVTAGADVTVKHRCTGTPLVCQPTTELDGAIALSAASAVEGVQFRWTVESPEGRALDATRRVTFDPGPDAAEAMVQIETDGTAISGDWVLRVEARDTAGVVGTAATRVSIGNEPPVVTETFVSNFHVFDTPSSRFTAQGSLSVVVADPDGDPLERRRVSAHHVGDGGASFDVQDLGDRVVFAVEVPYTQRSDASFLIGGEGLERTIAFAVRDVNGAETSERWPVIIGNSPPQLITSVASSAVNHSYSEGAYRASAVLSSWSDPDGDPLFQGDPTGDAACPGYTLDGSNRVIAQCVLVAPVAAAAGNFVAVHDVHQRVQDPWIKAAVSTSSALNILNRRPVIATSVTIDGPCTQTSRCCTSECIDKELLLYATGQTIRDFVVDPDGDPLRVTSAWGETVCLPSECSLRAEVGGISYCPGVSLKDRTYTLMATDGVIDSAEYEVLVIRLCEGS